MIDLKALLEGYCAARMRRPELLLCAKERLDDWRRAYHGYAKFPEETMVDYVRRNPRPLSHGG